jgi:hypothetical protein
MMDSDKMDGSEYDRYQKRSDIEENRLWDYYIVGKKLPEVNNV